MAALPEFEHFKVVTYLPEAYLATVVDALCDLGVNSIGNYANCLSWFPVTSTWTTLEGAQPFKGEVGKRSTESEMRLEFLCDATRVDAAVDCIRRNHPYEEPVIDLLPLIVPPK